jgi:hypothetical protein
MTAPLFGQTGGATLTGTITDPTGAVIANAPIIATHVETGTAIQAASSETGNYTIPNLRVGGYVIVVEQPGFKAFRREGITLASTQIQRLDVALQVGASTESVTVTAESTLLRTDSGALTHNITPDQIQALPLLPVGGFVRDPFALAQMLPGVVANPFAMRVNGLPTNSIQYRLDGEVLGQQGFAAITTRTQPSPDAIQEVAVQTSNFTAEFGSVAGALFNVSLKSGTNQLHGTVYDYAVNEVLNASDKASKANRSATVYKNRVRRHDYGFNLGGPIYIPGVYNGKNKSFFFFNWEQYRDKQLQNAGNPVPTVPIQAYRDGDFSSLFGALNNANLNLANGTAYVDPRGSTIRLGTIFDPNSTTTITCTAISPSCGAIGNNVSIRSPFPNNRVPQSQIDRVALAIQTKYIPLPNVNGALLNNYINSFFTTRITSSPAVKLDHNLGTKGRLGFTYSNNKTTSPVQATGGLARGLPEPITTNAGTFESGPSFRLNLDYTISPTTMLHVGTGYSMFSFASYGQTLDYNAETDIGLKGARLNRSFPQFAASAVTNPALGGMDPMGPLNDNAAPERRPSATVSLTVVRGNHTYKAGADWRQDMLVTQSYSNTTGNYGGFNANGVTWQTALQGAPGFSGVTQVGFGYANFLLGSVRTLTLAAPINYRRSKRQSGLFVQDTWRARRNLTVDYGLRWDYGTYAKEDYGRLGALSLTVPNPSASGRPGGLIYEATCNCQFAQNYPYAIGPRLGVAYTVTPKTVLRGGFGIAYGSTGVVGGAASNTAVLPDLANGENGFFLRDGIPSSVNPQWPLYEVNRGHAVGTVLGTAPALVDPNAGRAERVYQWNFSLQRELSRNLVVEATYTGNRAVWLAAGGLQDFNAVSEKTLNSYGFRVGNLTDASTLNTLRSGLTPAQAASVPLPYANFPGNQTVLQGLKPYPQYGSAIQPAGPLGKSWYDALQLTLNKRFSHGLQVNANYTYAKNLQHVSSPDVFNRSIGKDIVTANPPQVFRVSFQYEVPKPSPGMPVLGNKVVANVVGGWALSSAMFYQSAGFLGRPLHGAANPISRWLGRGPGGAMLRQNADGSYMSPWAVNWTDNDGKVHPEPLDINCGCFDPEKTIVLNPAAWQAVPDGIFSPQTQQLYDFRQSRRPSESFNVARNFRFGRESRYAFQVRVEFQNILNRTFLPAPVIAGQNFTGAPTLSGGRYTGGFGTFGNLQTNGAYTGQRSGQFIGRFTF